jgi:predicted lipoprotein with Yx(FWY)xxD motif
MPSMTGVRGYRIAVGTAALALLLAGGCGSSAPPSAPAGATPPSITASYMPQFKTSVLTDGGYALYIFLPDHRQEPTCRGSCAQIWPPVTIAHNQQATAGSGVQTSLLGSDPYAGSESIVTYNGWPLYRYLSDTTQYVAAGQGLNINGGYWYVIRPDGTAIVPPGDPPAS